MDMGAIIGAASELAKHSGGAAAGTGWTPTDYLLLVIIIGAFSSIITGFIKVKPALDKISSERDASLRQDLMQRIGTLEESMAKASLRHSEVIAKIKDEHSQEITRIREQMLNQQKVCEEENRDLRKQIDGLHRQIVQWQLVSGHAVPLNISPEARRAIDKITEALDLSDPERLSIITEVLETIRERQRAI